KRCSDSSPIFFELFLIDGFSSREYNVCRHDRSPSLLLRNSSRYTRPLRSRGPTRVDQVSVARIFHRKRSSSSSTAVTANRKRSRFWYCSLRALRYAVFLALCGNGNGRAQNPKHLLSLCDCG